MKNIIKGALCSLAISTAMLMSCGKDEDPNIIFNDIDEVATVKSELVEQIVNNTVSLKTDDTIKLNVGETFKLFENGEYNNVFSSDTSVVTVDSKGVLTAKNMGAAQIYVGINNKIAKSYQVYSFDNSKDYCYDYKENEFSTPIIDEAWNSNGNLFIAFCLDDAKDYYLIASFESSANNLEEFLKDQSAKFDKDKSSFYYDEENFDLKSAENVSLTKNADGNLVFHINFVTVIYGGEVHYELNYICVEPEHSK